MTNHDLHDDGYNRGENYVTGQEPTIKQLQTAISESSVSSSYPNLDRFTKNDLIGICRTERITVAGVMLPALPGMTITPAAPSVAVASTVQFEASQPGVSWGSATPATATIDASTGLATGVAEGTTVISASKDGYATESVTLTVTA